MRFDRKRWAGWAENYGHDWYRCPENEHISSWWTEEHDHALWLRCPLCDCLFHQSRLWRKWLSREQAVVCPACFEEAVWKAPKSMTREQVLDRKSKRLNSSQ